MSSVRKVQKMHKPQVPILSRYLFFDESNVGWYNLRVHKALIRVLFQRMGKTRSNKSPGKSLASVTLWRNSPNVWRSYLAPSRLRLVPAPRDRQIDHLTMQTLAEIRDQWGLRYPME